jgi:hypothetical protein
VEFSPTPSRHGHSRRAFFKRSGLVAGALFWASAGWEKTLGRAVAAVSAQTQGRSRRTYVGLVDALSASPRAGVRGGSAAEIEERFEGWYAAQAPTTQRIADSILEDLDASFESGSFHRAARGDRLQHIRTWYDSGAITGVNGRRADREWREGTLRKRQVAENAAKLAAGADPTDFSSVLVAQPDDSEPPISFPPLTAEEVHRHSLVAAALTLAAAPLHMRSDNPRGLAKVPPVTP